MSMTPLAVGVLTAAPESDNPAIRRAMEQMVKSASRAELEQALYDLAIVSCALCSTVSSQAGVPASEILENTIN
jgi:hypothetical protein